MSIGIDLGTTYSSAAYVSDNNDRPTVVNFKGERVALKSTVKYDDFKKDRVTKLETIECEVGIPLNPGSVMSESKKLLGKSFDEVSEEDKEKFGFKIVKGNSKHEKRVRIADIVNNCMKEELIVENEGDLMISARIGGHPARFHPYEISGEVLKYIKNSICDQISINKKEILDCIITVPADFSPLQREDTLKAAQLAGLNAQLLNEPTAAAITGAYKKVNGKFCIDNENFYLFVFDFGGGTLDCTIMKVLKGSDRPTFKVISTFGDGNLGGVNIDNAIVDFIKEKIKSDAPSLYKICFEGDKRNFYQNFMKQQAEEVKVNYNTIRSARFNIDFLTQNDSTNCTKNNNSNDDTESDSSDNDNNVSTVRSDYEITPDFWNKTMENISEKCLNVVKECLNRSYLNKTNIDKLLLIGGSSNLEYVSNKVVEFFGKEKLINLSTGINKQTAVAEGAALSLSSSCKFIDVCSRSLGVKAKDNGIPSVKTIIKSCRELPAFVDCYFSAEKQANKVEFGLYQGQEIVEGSYNQKLLNNKNKVTSFTIDGLPSLSGNDKVEFICRTTYNTNGMIEMCPYIISPSNYHIVDGSGKEAKFVFDFGRNRSSDHYRITSGVSPKSVKTKKVNRGEIKNGYKINISFNTNKIKNVSFEDVASKCPRCEGYLIPNLNKFECPFCGNSLKEYGKLVLSEFEKYKIGECDSKRSTGQLYIFCVDVSGSMSGSRINYCKRVMKTKINDIKLADSDSRVCLVKFESNITVYGDCCCSSINVGGCSSEYEIENGVKSLSDIKPICQTISSVTNTIDGLCASGGTNLGHAIMACYMICKRYESGRIILFTDGEGNESRDYYLNMANNHFKSNRNIVLDLYSFKDCGSYFKDLQCLVNVSNGGMNIFDTSTNKEDAIFKNAIGTDCKIELKSVPGIKLTARISGNNLNISGRTVVGMLQDNTPFDFDAEVTNSESIKKRDIIPVEFILQYIEKTNVIELVGYTVIQLTDGKTETNVTEEVGRMIRDIAKCGYENNDEDGKRQISNLRKFISNNVNDSKYKEKLDKMLKDFEYNFSIDKDSNKGNERIAFFRERMSCDLE